MNKAPKKSKDDREKKLDEAIEESFPASDPLTVTRTFAGAPNDRAGAKPKKGEHKDGKKRRK